MKWFSKDDGDKGPLGKIHSKASQSAAAERFQAASHNTSQLGAIVDRSDLCPRATQVFLNSLLNKNDKNKKLNDNQLMKILSKSPIKGKDLINKIKIKTGDVDNRIKMDAWGIAEPKGDKNLNHFSNGELNGGTGRHMKTNDGTTLSLIPKGQ